MDDGWRFLKDSALRIQAFEDSARWQIIPDDSDPYPTTLACSWSRYLPVVRDRDQGQPLPVPARPWTRQV